MNPRIYTFDEGQSLRIEHTGQQWIAEIMAIVPCRCMNDIEHAVDVNSVRTIDHHFAWVDTAMLNAYEGALRGNVDAARRLFLLLLQDEVQAAWFDPCEISNDPSS